jgi:hypothetical protein
MDACRLSYIRYLRERPRRSEAADVLREMKAREAELRIAERCHSLIETDESVATITDLCGLTVTLLSGMPAKIAGHDLALRRKVEQVIYDFRLTLVARLKEQIMALKTTGAAVNTPASYSRPRTEPALEDGRETDARSLRP